MAAGDDDGGRAHVLKAPRGIAGAGKRPGAMAGQRLGFRQIRRHDAGERQQLSAERLHAVFVEQSLPAFGHENRIHDHQGQLELFDGGDDRFDDRGICEHSDLGRIDLQIAGDRFDLRGDEVGRQWC